jgi:hypothetical protein
VVASRKLQVVLGVMNFLKLQPFALMLLAHLQELAHLLERY